MKKILFNTALLFTCFCFFLTGCSSTNNTNGSNGSSPTSNTSTRVASSTPQGTATASLDNMPSCSRWTNTSTPKAGGFHAMAAVSQNDVWMVGTNNNNTFIEHWDGSTWTIEDSPGVANMQNYFSVVQAVSAKDVWAVGAFYQGQVSRALVEHWDGSQWSILQQANPTGLNQDNVYTALTGVVAVSQNDVWAVGDRISGSGTPAQRLPLFEHWDGKEWKVVDGDNSVTYGELSAVTAIAANNIWAVGSTSEISAGRRSNLIEHWDGTKWQVVASPNLSIDGEEQLGFKSYNGLSSIDAVSATDIWTVGRAYTIDSGHIYTAPTLILHWDGSSWKTASLPVDTDSGNMPELTKIMAITAHDAWAVGNVNNQKTRSSAPLFMHWDGTQWSTSSVQAFSLNWNPVMTATRIPDSHQIVAAGWDSNRLYQAAICK